MVGREDAHRLLLPPKEVSRGRYGTRAGEGLLKVWGIQVPWHIGFVGLL